jgi:transcriptional regulator with XRE-family HTH domain
LSKIASKDDRIQFSEVLSELIEQSPFKKNRRPIWEKLSVSSSALSQYVTGQSRPRLETLIDLAEFFGVTLDYLILRRETPRAAPDDSRSMARYVDWALADVQAKVGQRSWLITRVGQVLAEQIDQAVEKVTPVGGARAGMLTTDEQLALEHYALRSMMLTPHLSYDVIDVNESETTAGRFGHVVADNLTSDPPRPYSILVPEDLAGELDGRIHAFRRLLREELAVPEERTKLWEVRVTKERMLVGSCFYQLDVEALETHEPMLWLTLKEFVNKDGWICYSIHDTDEITRGEVIVAKEHLPRALGIFNALWRESAPPSLQ